MALRHVVVAAVCGFFLVGATGAPDQQKTSQGLHQPDGWLLAQNADCNPPACTKRPKRKPQPDIPSLPQSAIPGTGPVIVAPITTDHTTSPASPLHGQHPAEANRPGPAGTNTPGNVAEGVVARHVGLENFSKLMQSRIENFNQQVDRRLGKGSPDASPFFEHAVPRDRPEENLSPAGTQFFQPAVTPAFKPTSQQDAHDIQQTYGSIGGGISLEGIAAGLGPIARIQYHAVLNALMLDNRAAYFFPISGQNVAVLCRALARDERVGVSVGHDLHQVYGELPPTSQPALSLMLADSFLGDIVFAGDRLADYRFADNYQPQQYRGSYFPMLVHFNFGNYRFDIVDQQIRATTFSFSDEMFPVSATKGRDGGMLADDDAIRQGKTVPEFEANARHLADNISYYRGERIVGLAFQYGEVAALLRGLKADGVDLNALAGSIESVLGPAPQPSAAIAGADLNVVLEHEWEEYLKEIQDHHQYGNWSGPPYDFYVKRLAQSKARSAQTLRVIRVAGDDVLNIRSGPGADYSILGRIPPNGRGVHIVGACTGQWCVVEYGGSRGWTNGYYLEPEQGQATDSYRVVNVAADDSLNVRQGPGARYAIVAALPPDSRGLRLVGSAQCVGVWCEIQYRAGTGWVNTLYLEYDMAAAAAPTQTYRVTNVATDDVLHIRSGPGAGLASIGSIPPNGRGVRIVGSCSGPWCPIEYQGTRGWVNKQYLLDDTATAAAPARTQTYRVTNVAADDVLNIRPGPGAGLASVGSIPPNARGVRIVGSCSGQWCPIDYQGTRGWVNKLYLSTDF
jgi:uncharacterized protein YraI